MTNKEKKDFLRQYRRLKSKEHGLVDQIKAAQFAAMVITPAYSDMPRGGGDGRKIENCICMIDNRIAKLEAVLQEVKDTEEHIASAIDTISDPQLRDLIWYKYICLMSWEDIAELMGYSVRHITRLHGRALSALQL